MRFIAIAMVMLTGAAVRADACRCLPRGAPCAEYWQVAAMFAGTVRDIRPVPQRPEMRAVHFDVDQPGRGVDGKTVVVESAPQNGENCGYTFHVGQRYVVYAYAGPTGQLTTDMCSSKRAADAATELAFLKEAMGPPRGVRVLGHIRRQEYDLVSFNQRDYGGVAGARVQVKGGGISRETISGPDGDYDIRDLPPGTYNITIALPNGLALAGPPLPRDDHHPRMEPVTLTHPFECSEMRTWPRTDSRITGTVVDGSGRAVANEEIHLIAASNARSRDRQIPHVSVRSGRDGRFVFAFIPPGRYLVGVNLRYPPSATQADRRTYHPGVSDAAKATVVTVVAGSRVLLGAFPLPK